MAKKLVETLCVHVCVCVCRGARVCARVYVCVFMEGSGQLHVLFLRLCSALKMFPPLC